MRRVRPTLAAVLAAGALLAPHASAGPVAKPPAAPVRLVYHVESADGTVLESSGGEEPFNPASLVKAATTLWAIEQLGPEHRFETRFAALGTLDATAGRLDGDLVVLGGGDPDFHLENAVLVARALADRGVREVTGRLLVDDAFWIGWEGGSEERETDPARRARQMAERLARAFDPQRWTDSERAYLRDVERQRGVTPRPFERILARGGTGRFAFPPGTLHDLVVHRSNTLAHQLKRLNAYSNNDIERFEWSLGTPEELSRWLASRWSVAPAEVRLSTLSGLGSNRLSPRLGVRLLRDLRESSVAHGLDLADLLPVAGCDPGTLKLYPRLVRGKNARAVVAKTGTLTRTDGGVSVLAGVASTAAGDRLFCIAAPDSGAQIWNARKAQEQWVVDLLAQGGGAQGRACGSRPGLPDTGAEVVSRGAAGSGSAAAAHGP